MQSNVMKTFKIKWYIIQNVQNNCESFRFVLNVIHYIKNISMMETSAQLTWMWNCLNVSLYKNIHCLTDLITVSLFIEDMKNIKKMWFDKYNFHDFTVKSSSIQQNQQQQQCWQQNNAFDNYLFHSYDQFQESQFSYYSLY